LFAPDDMSQPETRKFSIEGLPELWVPPAHISENAQYKAAVLVESTLNFRSLRAGLNHSEDRSFTAWLPEHDLAIDWDSPAVSLADNVHLEFGGDPSVGYVTCDYEATADTLKQYLDELMDKLIRNERLKVFYSPAFEMFSSPGDPLEDFLSRVADAALRRVEPELKSLRRKFELQLEQIREAQARKGLSSEGIGLDSLQIRNLQLSESENRLASIFSTLAGTVFGTPEPRQDQDEARDDDLKQDLERMEQEASNALRSLYDEYMTLANEYDIFEIGLQSENIQVLRLALLWAPIE
jgi:hypothetical protein